MSPWIAAARACLRVKRKRYRGLQNLDAPRKGNEHAGRAAPIGANFSCKRKVPKGFNSVSVKSLFGWADLRFGKPRKFPKRERIVTFCIVQKVTKKHVLGRAKSCQWQVFVRRRPPKQGELRTDVSKATMFQGVDSVLRPRFKALPEKILTKFFDDTSRTRLFAQDGGEKALNRCDAPALQRKELERTAKEQPCSLVNSRLWLSGNLRCLRLKRVALESNKESSEKERLLACGNK